MECREDVQLTHSDLSVSPKLATRRQQNTVWTIPYPHNVGVRRVQPTLPHQANMLSLS